jgi:mono/diheme cytochrome c family protein
MCIVAFAALYGMTTVFAQTASSDDPAWVALPDDLEPSLSDPLLRPGQAVYINRCGSCHDAVPDEVFGPLFLPPMPGTQVLAERYRGALPAVLHERTDLPAAYIETVVRRGLGSMPFFRPTEVSDDDLQALIAFLTRPRDQRDD